jgi:hypothetical protein
MKPYFSGIAGPSEFRRLEAAGVSRLLVDPFDRIHLVGRAHVALDSGAYRTVKHDLSLDLEIHLTFARGHGPFDFAVSLDEICDLRVSVENWGRLRRSRSDDDPTLIPVSHRGGERGDVELYLDETSVLFPGQSLEARHRL